MQLPRQFIKTYTIASGVAAGAITPVTISTKDAEEYGPFNLVNVVNKSGQVVALYPDGDSNKMLVCGNSYDKVWSDIPFKSLILKNLDGSNATDAAVYVTIQNDIGPRLFLQKLTESVRGKAVS